MSVKSQEKCGGILNDIQNSDINWCLPIKANIVTCHTVAGKAQVSSVTLITTVNYICFKGLVLCIFAQWNILLGHLKELGHH